MMDVDTLAKIGVPVATAIIGFVGGIFSDGIKDAIKRRHDLICLKRSLYWEPILRLK